MFDIGSDPNAPRYIPGYTGHIPKHWVEDDYQKEGCSYYIPKYSGFVPSISSENIHGKTFGEATAVALGGTYNKGFNHPPQAIFKTTAQAAFEPEGKDYFFSFSRLTDAEKKQAKEEMKRSMELKMAGTPPHNQGPRQITMTLDDLYGNNRCQPQNCQPQQSMDYHSRHMMADQSLNQPGCNTGCQQQKSCGQPMQGQCGQQYQCAPRK